MAERRRLHVFYLSQPQCAVAGGYCLRRGTHKANMAGHRDGKAYRKEQMEVRIYALAAFVAVVQNAGEDIFLAEKLFSLAFFTS